MFKKLLPASARASASASGTAPPSPPPSREKAGHTRNAVPREEDRSKPREETITNEGKSIDCKNIDEPELVLPPASYSPTVVAPQLNRGSEKDEEERSDSNQKGHTREVSIDTTTSQSIDLSGLLKNLEDSLQHDLGEQRGGETAEASSFGADEPGNCKYHSPTSIEVAHIDCTGTRRDSCKTSSSDTVSSGITDNDKATSKTETTGVVRELSSESATPFASVNEDSDCPSSTPLADSGHDLHTMVQVGQQLFLESLETHVKEEIQSFATTSESLVPGMEKKGKDIDRDKAPVDVRANTVSSNKAICANRAVVKKTIFVGIGVIVAVWFFAFDNGCIILRNPNSSTAQIADTEDLHSVEEHFSLPITNVHSSVEINNTADRNSDEPSITSGFKGQIKSKETMDHQNGEGPIVSRTVSSMQIENRADDHNDAIPILPSTTSNTQVEDSSDDNEEKPPDESCDSNFGSCDAPEGGPSGSTLIEPSITFAFCSWLTALFFVAWVLRIWFQATLASRFLMPKVEGKTKMEPMSPICSLPRHRQGHFLTPPPLSKHRSMEPSEWMSPCYGEDALDVSVYESMKAAELRKLLRDRKCDYRGTKQQMIKMLVQSYQNELACLTVQQLRPKLRKRKLSQKGSKKDVVRRLVEAGPV